MADWIDALRSEVQASSQSAVAKRLNYSPTAISLVLKGTYPGSLARVEARVRHVLLVGQVQCPLLGPLSLKDCLDHQARPFSPTNPQRAALHRACRTCPHRATSR